MSKTVGLFIPCYIDQCFPHVAEATVYLLERLGIQCDFDRRQTCCGQPAFNSGYHREACQVAEHWIEVFDKYETIVAPGGSCVSMVRNHYGELLGRDEPVTQRVFELCDYIVNHLKVEDVGAKMDARVALHIPCHMRRELDGPGPTRQLMENVEGLRMVDLPSDEWCCGFGGTFSVKHPDLSAAMGRRKLETIRDAGLRYLVSPDSSCLMHLGGLAKREGYDIEWMHVAEVLAGKGEN